MLNKIIKFNLAVLFLTTISFAEVILDITVNGNKRISKETLIVFSEIKKGADYTSDDLNKSLKKIYSTNFFKSVNLNIEKSILNIEVVENPIISGVEIKGIKSKKLNDFISEKLLLKNRSSFIESKFKNDVNLVNNILKSSGYYFAEIQTKSILNEELNSIQIIYDVDLGSKARITKIQFLGDKKIKDRKLYGIITSEEARFWKFLSQSIYLNYDRIERDKRLLKNFYKDSGYYNANITNSFVEINNNGQFKLIFNIVSGKKFTFNKLDLILSEDYDSKHFQDIKKLLKKLENKNYSFSKMEKVLRQIDKIALTKQYEFINASLKEKIVDENKLDVLITLVETDKFYVERINILGNSYTLEEVIRNVFIVDEGDAYNEILFNKSINLIRAKNIFSKVESKTSEGSNPSFKVIDITVEEKATGEISLGAGVGSNGATIGGGLKENNFLGKGIKLNTNLQLTANSVKGSFTHVKPNFNYTDNTLFTTVKSTETDNLTDFGYKTTNIGFSLGTSFEQYENFYFQPELAASYEELVTNTDASSGLKKQTGDYLDTYFNYSLTYDGRDKVYRPEEGFRNQFYQELPLVSDNSEIVNSFETTKFKKFSKILTTISYYGKAVNTLSGEDVRISKRLYVPKNKLRGFENGKIGPIENNDFIGGNYVSSINFNAALPEFLPNFQNTDISFFIDAASVWGVDYNSEVDKNKKIRSATGLGLDIFTPIGPLSFSLSYPITKASSDKTETFRFNLGTTF